MCECVGRGEGGREESREKTLGRAVLHCRCGTLRGGGRTRRQEPGRVNRGKGRQEGEMERRNTEPEKER